MSDGSETGARRQREIRPGGDDDPARSKYIDSLLAKLRGDRAVKWPATMKSRTDKGVDDETSRRA